MEKKEFRPGNIVRSKVNYSGMGLDLREGEVFELPNSADTIHSWQDMGASGKMLLSDCEPVKADLFSLKKLRFEQKEAVSSSKMNNLKTKVTSGRSYIDFVYEDKFTIRFNEWHEEKGGKLEFTQTVELLFAGFPIPMNKEIEFIHEVQNWYYLFTGDEITIQGE